METFREMFLDGIHFSMERWAWDKAFLHVGAEREPNQESCRDGIVMIYDKTFAFLCGIFGFFLCLGAFIEILGLDRRDSLFGLILIGISAILYEIKELKKGKKEE